MYFFVHAIDGANTFSEMGIYQCNLCFDRALLFTGNLDKGGRVFTIKSVFPPLLFLLFSIFYYFLFLSLSLSQNDIFPDFLKSGLECSLTKKVT